MKISTDFLVIGSGIAGLSYALKVADQGTVALITKRDIDVTATQLAQGGIATVFSAEDSFESHVEDTMVAGAHLPHREIVEKVVKAGPEAIRNLIDWGVQFSRNEDNEYSLTREGGHSHRRILHAKDATGREIERALVEAASAHPNITLYEDHIAVDLITEAKLRRKTWSRTAAWGPTSWTNRLARSIPLVPVSPSWQPEAQARSICLPAIPTSQPETASPLAGGPGPMWLIWSSCSSTRQPSFTHMPSHS